ncbi:MAG: ABC transporter ATP-binding protein [Lachnospiraceae bacterium]|nr:ABC transporter ATP-binding protein [Lachnospiraceae bacterium]
MINIINITKSYGDDPIFKKINLCLADTGFYILLGASGSGKTTLLNILYGIETFSSEEGGGIEFNKAVYVNRVDMSVMKIYAEYITQNPIFIDYLTIKENLSIVGEGCEKWLKEFGLEAIADRLPDELSGGERQRAAIIRALMGGKSILLCDEPTASLDRESKHTVFRLLRELGRSVLIICSTHDRTALDYADVCLTIDRYGITASELHKASSTAKETVTAKARALFSAVKPLPDTKRHKLAGCCIKKWFTAHKNRRRQGLSFAFFTFWAFILLFLSDTEIHRTDNKGTYLYGLNMVSLHTRGSDLTSLPPEWNAIQNDRRILHISLAYQGSYPVKEPELINGLYSVEPAEDMVAPITLPFDKEYCHIANSVKYGQYFSEPDQVMLSYDMALRLEPFTPEKLIGTELDVDLYGLSKQHLTIVGIFDSFTPGECKWLEQYSHYPSWDNVYFINDRLTAEMAGSEELYSSDGGRTYHLYFSSYKNAKAFVMDYNSVRSQSKPYTLSNHPSAGNNTDSALSIILLPMSLIMMLLSVLFFSQMVRIEFIHDHGFITALEYNGCSRKWLMRRFYSLQILNIAKTVGFSLIAAFGVSAAINLYNHIFRPIWHLIFSYNTLLCFLLYTCTVLLSWLVTVILYRKLRDMSWYADRIVSRDLL